ncbi:MAG TPA: nitroreductase family protein [Umezawaea sp.]|nr:nitroreductase family protein [Umezawaea sp.]
MSSVVPALGLAEDDVRDVLETASLAPSRYNAQPWRFALHPDRIELHGDPGGLLEAADPEWREVRLSCGTALLNARLALQGLGIRPLVTLLPGRGAIGALAVVRRGGRFTATDESRSLLDAVGTRRTNRLPFLDTEVPVEHRQHLVRAAELERSWLHVVGADADRERLRNLVLRAHRAQLADPAAVEVSASEVESALSNPWALHDFSPEPVERPPDTFVVVLCSFYDGPQAELQAGQALQRMLLAAAALGLSASFLSQVVEVRRVREELRRALGGSLFPQSVLRLGFGAPAPPTPRKPVEDLILAPCGVEPESG